MLNEKQIILEIEVIQCIIDSTYVCNSVTLREAIDNLRITSAYIKFDNECLKRELIYAKKSE